MPSVDGMRMGRLRKNNKKRNRSAIALLTEFWKLLGDQRKRVIITLLTLTVATVIGLLPLYAPKIVFDNVLGEVPMSPQLRSVVGDISKGTLLLVVVLVMVALALVGVFINTMSRWTATQSAFRVRVDVRKKAFEHAVKLPLHRVQELKSGGVSSMLRDDAAAAGNLVFELLYNPVRAVVQLLGSLAVLAYTDWRLLALFFAVVPIIWFTHRLWIARIRPMFWDIRASRQMIDAHATESFGGMRVVRSFGKQKQEAGRFIRNNDVMVRQEILSWWLSRGVEALWGVLIPVATAGLLLYGGSRVLADQAAITAGTLNPAAALTTGDLWLFLGYLTALLGPIATLAASATGLQNNLAGLDRTLDLLDEPMEPAAQPGKEKLLKGEVLGRISLKSVHYTYPGTEKSALHDINLEVPAGSTVALVGPSGAGKTTLSNLIARFFEPTAGTLLLDGKDVRDIDLESYRRLLGVVEQDTFLFDGTVGQNISYANARASQEQVIRAAKLANAHGFISDMQEGYNTLVGERGVKLSGGQRQRLTIARAILADPKLLILDEATSNLDTESERLIQNSLSTLLKGRTSFVIAHRLSTIRNADLIVVVDQGRIAEMGTHAELIATSGRYATMVDLQTRTQEDVREMVAE